MSLARIARLAALLAGLWLMVAPAALGHDGTAMADSDRIVGPIAASCAFVAAWAVVDGVRWGLLPCAAWAVIAPWILDADPAATTSSTLAGVVFGLSATVGVDASERFGDGWRSVRPATWRDE